MMVTVSSEELAKSGLFIAWMRQAVSALLITGMELERKIWEDVRAIKVALHEKTALQAYGTGMRAILLRMLHSLETREEPAG